MHLGKISSVISSLFLFLILLIIFNCASTGVVLLDDTIKYPPSENVEILIEKPKRPHKVIAKLETKGIKGTSHTTILESMRKKAKSIGADAIIPAEDASEYQLPGIMYNPWLGGYQTLPGGKVPILRGYAIIYLNSFSSDREKNQINSDLLLSNLIEDRKEKYIVIEKVVKQYLLITISRDIQIDLNDIYDIVDGTNKIGEAKVVRIKGNKIGMQIIQSEIDISTAHKIKYNK